MRNKSYTTFRLSIFTCTPSMITVNAGTGVHRHGGEGALINKLNQVIETDFGLCGYVVNNVLYIPGTPANRKTLSELSTIFALHENIYPVIIDEEEFKLVLRRY